MPQGVSKSDLSTSRARVIEMMQNLGFGIIENLIIHNCEPIVDPPPRVTRTVKLCGENGPRPEVNLEDFVLKAEVRDLFAYFDSLKNGTI